MCLFAYFHYFVVKHLLAGCVKVVKKQQRELQFALL